MILLIHGPTHTGKTYVAQKILEIYKYPYLSIDHLKMGLIRSGYTRLALEDSVLKLTKEFWPIIREMIKTAIENEQNLVIEGCYIPFDYAKDFDPIYLKDIAYICLIFDEVYIKNHYKDIIAYQSIVEKRVSDDLTIKSLRAENHYFHAQIRLNALNYFIIKDSFDIDAIIKKIKGIIAMEPKS